jgi:hypothetical protein
LFFFIKLPLGQSPGLVSCDSLGCHSAWFVCCQDLCTRFLIPSSLCRSWRQPDLDFSAVFLPLSTQWPGQISHSDHLGLLVRFPLPLCVLHVAELPARSQAERGTVFCSCLVRSSPYFPLTTGLRPRPCQSVRSGFSFAATSFHGASPLADLPARSHRVVKLSYSRRSVWSLACELLFCSGFTSPAWCSRYHCARVAFAAVSQI